MKKRYKDMTEEEKSLFRNWAWSWAALIVSVISLIVVLVGK